MTRQAAQHRDRAIALANQAHSLLLQACQAACPLVGWASRWQDIGDTADLVQGLVHRLLEAAPPDRLDSEPG